MTPIKKIIDFVNGKDKPMWWRYTVNLALMKGHLDVHDYKSIYEISLMDVGLLPKSDVFESYNTSVSDEGFESEEHPVVLISIDEVSNVSALQKSEKLNFNKNGMTVIYGDNGSGKSSYSKILKNACLTRGDLPNVTGNIFKDDKSTPQAKICVSVNDNSSESHLWKNKEKSNSLLKSIRVFDSQSASHYVAKEGEIEYKPAGLQLLDELNAVCQYISAQLDIAKKKYSTPIILPSLSLKTEVGKFVTQIKSKTTVDQLSVYCLSPEQIEKIEPLRIEYLLLKSKTAEQIKKELSDKRKRIEPLRNAIKVLVESLNDEAVTIIQTMFDDYQEKAKSADLLKESILNGLPLSNIGGTSWKLMWQAAESFIINDNISHKFPTNLGDICPLCLQDVQQVSHARLQQFYRFLNDTTQQQATIAQEIFQKKILVVKELVINFDAYIPILDELEESKAGFKNRILALVNSFQQRKKELLSDPIVFSQNALDFLVLKEISDKIDHLIQDELNMKDNQTFSLAIEKLSLDILELENRKVFTENIINYKNEIVRQEKLSLISLIEKNTATAQITRLSSNINQDVVISKIGSAFTDELKMLGFNHYNVDIMTRGSRGTQLLKIALKNSITNSVIDIASEGEQKCLALASFLAEIHADNRKSAVIFDDPVNSLDHKWRRKFANRLVKESLVRQVIVFTHDLTFLKMLEEFAGTSSSEFKVNALIRQKGVVGVVRDNPPWDALKTQTRIGSLKNEVVRLTTIHASPTEPPESYIDGVGRFYGKMRETWERLVEEWLIRNVVERFSREVKTQNVRYLIDITESDNDAISLAMKKCSTFLDGHDDAPELGVDIPEPTELAVDLAALEKYFVELKKRRQG